MNEKLEIAKNEICKQYGYGNWKSMLTNISTFNNLEKDILFDLLSERYHELMSVDIQEKIAVDIHHVVNRKQNSKLLNEITNLVALCRSCHHTKGDKVQYIAEFQDIINKRHGF